VVILLRSSLKNGKSVSPKKLKKARAWWNRDRGDLRRAGKSRVGGHYYVVRGVILVKGRGE